MVVLIVLLAVLFLIYYLSTYKFNYWKNKNVPYSKPVPLFGNFKDYILLKRSIIDVYHDLVCQFKNVPYFGVFYGTEPALVVTDPDIIKTICTKDFYYFNSRENADFTSVDPAGRTLVGSYGDYWKVMRQNLTPMFTSAKMKNMFQLVLKGAKSFEKVLSKETKQKALLDGHALVSRYTMSGIGSCTFGIDTQTLDNDIENNSFTRSGNLLFYVNKTRAYIVIIRSIWPQLFYKLHIDILPSNVIMFFKNLVLDIFKQRGYKPSNRKDFVDLMFGLSKEEKIVGDGLSNPNSGDIKKFAIEMNDEVLAFTCTSIFAAGYETIAQTINNALYELAQNKKAQKRAQEEIDQYLRKHENKLEYDSLSELVFLQACIDETLRLYPVLPMVTREVTENYEFLTGLKVEKGLRIHFPVRSIHRNPDYFQNPDTFDPDRFMPGRKEHVMPYTFMPFGEGPRTCLGMRFAKMQLLTGLVTVVKKYDIEATRTPIPGFSFLLNHVVPRDVIEVKLKQRLDDQTNNYDL